MFVKIFEGEEDAIESVVHVLDGAGKAVAYTSGNNDFTASVTASDYVDCLNLASKKIPGKIARKLTVVAPDGVTKTNLFLIKLAFENKKMKNISPIFTSENAQNIDYLGQKLEKLGFETEVYHVVKNTIYVPDREYVYAVVVGSEICKLENIQNVSAVLQNVSDNLDIDGLYQKSEELNASENC